MSPILPKVKTNQGHNFKSILTYHNLKVGGESRQPIETKFRVTEQMLRYKYTRKMINHIKKNRKNGKILMPLFESYRDLKKYIAKSQYKKSGHFRYVPMELAIGKGEVTAMITKPGIFGGGNYAQYISKTDFNAYCKVIKIGGKIYSKNPNPKFVSCGEQNYNIKQLKGPIKLGDYVNTAKAMFKGDFLMYDEVGRRYLCERVGMDFDSRPEIDLSDWHDVTPQLFEWLKKNTIDNQEAFDWETIDPLHSYHVTFDSEYTNLHRDRGKSETWWVCLKCGSINTCKGSGYHSHLDAVLNGFAKPAADSIDGKVPHNAKYCGGCHESNAMVEVELDEINMHDYEYAEEAIYNVSLNSVLSQLMLMNYLDGADIADSKNYVMRNELNNFIKAKAKIQLRTQYFPSILDFNTMSVFGEVYQNLEFLPRNSMTDMGSEVMLDVGCLLSCLFSMNVRKGMNVMGTNSNIVNHADKEPRYYSSMNCDHYANIAEIIDQQEVDVFNYNSLPDLKTLLDLSSRKRVYYIIPRINDQMNGFLLNRSLELSIEKSKIRLLMQGTTKILQYSRNEFETLLYADLINVGNQAYVNTTIKRGVLFDLKMIHLNEGESSLKDYKTMSCYNNLYSLFSLQIPDWQNKVLGVQLGPLRRKNVLVIMPFLEHLVGRCHAWPVSYHGLLEYAITSSFTRVEKDDKYTNIFPIDYDSISDHVFIAYVLYIKEMLNTSFSKWMLVKRKYGLETLIQTVIGGLNEMSAEVSWIQSIKGLINGIFSLPEEECWLMNLSWDKMEEIRTKWKTRPYNVLELNEDFKSDLSKRKLCRHHKPINDIIIGGCKCCNSVVMDDELYCKECKDRKEVCIHGCEHKCKGFRSHYCGINKEEEVYAEESVKRCEHGVRICVCCKVEGCYEICNNCNKPDSYEDFKVSEIEIPKIKMEEIPRRDEGAYVSIEDNTHAHKCFRCHKWFEHSHEKGEVRHTNTIDQCPRCRDQVERFTVKSEERKKKDRNLTTEPKPITDSERLKRYNEETERINKEIAPKLKTLSDVVNREEERVLPEVENIDNVIETAQHIYWVEKLRQLTDEDYLNCVLKVRQGEIKSNGDFTSSKYLPGGSILLNERNIVKIEEIQNVNYTEPGYCLRDCMIHFYDDLTILGWLQASEEFNFNSINTGLNEIEAVAKGLRVNVLCLVEKIDAVEYTYGGYVSDPSDDRLAVIMLKYSETDKKRLNEGDTSVIGHYVPVKLTVKSTLAKIPIYDGTMTTDHVFDIMDELKVNNPLDVMNEKRLEVKLNIFTSLNRRLREEYIESYVKWLEWTPEKKNYYVYNNADCVNNPRTGYVDLSIPMSFKNCLPILRCQTEMELVNTLMGCKQHMEEISNDNLNEQQRLLYWSEAYMKLKLTVDRHEKDKLGKGEFQYKFDTNLTVEGQYAYSDDNTLFSRVKTGDVVGLTLINGQRINVQVSIRGNRMILMNSDIEYSQLVGVIIYKQSYASLLIELSSMSRKESTIDKVMNLLRKGKGYIGFPGTGKTRHLLSHLTKDCVIIGVSRGSQRSLRQQLKQLKTQARVISLERAMEEKVRHKRVLIDEASLVNVSKLSYALTDEVEELVLAGDLSQIPYKEFSDLCEYMPSNILSMMKDLNENNLTELKVSFRYGNSICELLNKAFDANITSNKVNDTELELIHTHGLRSKPLKETIHKKRIEVVYVFTVETENRVRELLKGVHVDVKRVHSNQGESVSRGMIVLGHGESLSSESVQYKKEYLLVAITRCSDSLTIVCPQKECSNEGNTMENLINHVNREYIFEQSLKGGMVPEALIIGHGIKSILGFKERSRGNVNPDPVKDWLFEFYNIFNEKLNDYKWNYMNNLITQRKVTELRKVFRDRGFTEIVNVEEKKGKIMLKLNPDEVKDLILKDRLLLYLNNDEVELKVEGNDILIGNRKIMSKEEVVTTKVLSKDLDSWNMTKKSKNLIEVTDFRCIKAKNVFNVNKNIRMINHASQLFRNASMMQLQIEIGGCKFVVKHTAGCSLCGGLEFRSLGNDLIAFTNNTYDSLKVRKLYVTSHVLYRQHVAVLEELWLSVEDYWWPVVDRLTPECDLDKLHICMWVERIGTAFKGLTQGATINVKEGHLFKNDMMSNERTLIRYSDVLMRENAEMISKNHFVHAFMKNLSYLFKIKTVKGTKYAYFKNYSEAVILNGPWNTNYREFVGKLLWTNELNRNPFNMMRITKDVKLEGYGHLIRDLNKEGIYKLDKSEVCKIIDQEILERLKTCGKLMDVELHVPNNLIEVAKSMGLGQSMTIRRDMEIFIGGASYLMDAKVVRILAKHIPNVSKAMFTRFINVSLRQEVERQVKMVACPRDFNILQNCKDDVLNYYENKLKSMENTKFKKDLSNESDYSKEIRAIKNCISASDISHLMKGYENKCELLVLGMSSFNYSKKEIMMLRTKHNAKQVIMCIPDLRQEAVRNNFKVVGDVIIGRDDKYDYSIQADWAPLIETLMNKHRYEEVCFINDFQVIGVMDHLLILRLIDQNEDSTYLWPKFLSTDEVVVSIPRLNDLSSLLRGNSGFMQIKTLSIPKDILGRLVKRATVPGTTLDSIQTIARNRFATVDVSKYGVRGGDANQLYKYINLVSLVAEFIAKGDYNALNKYLSNVHDHLMDNKDPKRSTGIIMDLLSLHKDTLMGNLLNVNINLSLGMEILGEIMNAVMEVENKEQWKLVFHKHQHRIAYGSFYYADLTLEPLISKELIYKPVRGILDALLGKKKNGYWENKVDNKVIKFTRRNKNGEVWLMHYDLSQGVSSLINHYWFKEENKDPIVWHTSLRIDDQEVCFGNGITVNKIGKITPNLKPASIYIGRINWSDLEIEKLLNRMSNKYTAQNYSLLKLNCNHFTKELIKELTGEEFTDHFSNTPDRLISVLPEKWRLRIINIDKDIRLGNESEEVTTIMDEELSCLLKNENAWKDVETEKNSMKDYKKMIIGNKYEELLRDLEKGKDTEEYLRMLNIETFDMQQELDWIKKITSEQSWLEYVQNLPTLIRDIFVNQDWSWSHWREVINRLKKATDRKSSMQELTNLTKRVIKACKQPVLTVDIVKVDNSKSYTTLGAWLVNETSEVREELMETLGIDEHEKLTVDHIEDKIQDYVLNKVSEFNYVVDADKARLMEQFLREAEMFTIPNIGGGNCGPLALNYFIKKHELKIPHPFSTIREYMEVPLYGITMEYRWVSISEIMYICHVLNVGLAVKTVFDSERNTYSWDVYIIRPRMVYLVFINNNHWEAIDFKKEEETKSMSRMIMERISETAKKGKEFISNLLSVEISDAEEEESFKEPYPGFYSTKKRVPVEGKDLDYDIFSENEKFVDTVDTLYDEKEIEHFETTVETNNEMTINSMEVLNVSRKETTANTGLNIKLEDVLGKGTLEMEFRRERLSSISSVSSDESVLSTKSVKEKCAEIEEKIELEKKTNAEELKAKNLKEKEKEHTNEITKTWAERLRATMTFDVIAALKESTVYLEATPTMQLEMLVGVKQCRNEEDFKKQLVYYFERKKEEDLKSEVIKNRENRENKFNASNAIRDIKFSRTDLQGLNILIVCVGSSGDIIPVIRFANELVKTGVRITICTHYDAKGLHLLDELIKVEKVLISQEDTGNKNIGSVEEAWRFTMENNYKIMESMIKCFKNNKKINLVFTTPILPGSTGLSMTLGLPTIELFCTYPWNSKQGLLVTVINFGNSLMQMMQKIIQEISGYGWETIRSAISSRCLQGFGFKDCDVDVNTAGRMILSSKSFFSGYNVSDKEMFMGYQFEPTRTCVIDENELPRLKMLVSFGSMIVDDGKLKLIRTIIQRMLSKEVVIDVHIPNTKKNLNLQKLCKTLNCHIIMGIINLGETVFKYDWMLMHGGIGTLQDALYAKTVPIILPFFADQPFLARRVSEMKLGYVANLDITYEKLVENLKENLLAIENFINVEKLHKRSNLQAVETHLRNNKEKYELIELELPEIKETLELTIDLTVKSKGEVPNLQMNCGVYQLKNIRQIANWMENNKTSDTLYGVDCLPLAIEKGLIMLENSHLNEMQLFLAENKMNNLEDLKHLRYFAYKCEVNLQLMGEVNEYIMFNKNWKCLSLGICISEEKDVGHVINTRFYPDVEEIPSIKLVKGHMIDGYLRVLKEELEVESSIELLSDVNSILNQNDTIRVNLVTHYGGLDNLRARCSLANLDSVAQSTRRYNLEIRSLEKYSKDLQKNLKTFKMRGQATLLQVGELLAVLTDEGFVIGMYIGLGTFVTNKDFSKFLRVIVPLRIKRAKTTALTLKKFKISGPQFVLNKSTLIWMNRKFPGYRCDLIDPESYSDLEKIGKSVIVVEGDTRTHHDDRRKFELQVLKEAPRHFIKCLGNNDLAAILNNINKFKFVYISFNYEYVHVNLECVNLFTSSIVGKKVGVLLGKMPIKKNDGLLNLVKIEFLAELYRVEELMSELCVLVESTKLSIKTANLLGPMTQMLTKNTLAITHRVPTDEKLEELFGNEKKLKVLVEMTDPLTNPDMINELTLRNMVYIKEKNLGYLLMPFSKFSIQDLKGGRSFNTDVFNVNANEMVSDTNRKGTVEHPPGKEIEGQMNRWLASNKHLESKDLNLKVKQKAKEHFSKMRIPWEEIYDYIETEEVVNAVQLTKLIEIDVDLKENQFFQKFNNESFGEYPSTRFLEDHRIADLWNTSLDLLDHAVIHAPKNEQHYKLKFGIFGMAKMRKFIFTTMPERCRPIIANEIFASLNSLTGRLGRSIKLRKDIRNDQYVDEAIKNMERMFFRKNWRDISDKFQKEPIMLNDKEFRDWVMGHKNAHKVIKELEMLMSDGLTLHPLNLFRSHVKTESLNKEEAINDFRQSAPRAIVWLPYCMPAIFSYVMKQAANRFKEFLRSNIKYTAGMDVEDMANFLNNISVEDCFAFDSDISKMDSQVDEQNINVEWEMLKLCGVPEECLESYKHLKKNWRVSNRWVSVRGNYMRHTGEPTTALGNGIINLCMTSFILKDVPREDLKMCMFIGDDSIMYINNRNKLDLQVLKNRAKSLCNMLIKPSIHLSCGPFCSFVVGKSVYNSNLTIVPNIMRLMFKWEVPNGVGEVSEETLLTRQMSYACLLGRNGFGENVRQLILKATNNELDTPIYYNDADLIGLNAIFNNVSNEIITENLMFFYESIRKPQLKEIQFSVNVEDPRKFIKKHSEIKSSSIENVNFNNKLLDWE